MPILSVIEMQQMWMQLDGIENTINDLYVNRKVFSVATVHRLLRAVQDMKTKLQRLQSER